MADEKPKNEHERVWNAPECDEISVLLPHSDDIAYRDIIIPYNDDSLGRINELNPAYDCL